MVKLLFSLGPWLLFSAAKASTLDPFAVEASGRDPKAGVAGCPMPWAPSVYICAYTNTQIHACMYVCIYLYTLYYHYMYIYI